MSQDRRGKELLDDVVKLFMDLLLASGATLTMIDDATSKSKSGAKIDLRPLLRNWERCSATAWK